MNQHLHLISLGVRDFQRSYQSYCETLGWKPASARAAMLPFSRQAVSFSPSTHARNWPQTP